MQREFPTRIVSGGQTGVDRAALDLALELGLECGGWVPAGRWAEDGPISERYPDLIETTSSKLRVRTSRNVRDSDATLIITQGPVTGGTELTVRLAKQRGRPLLVVDLAEIEEVVAIRMLSDWLDEQRPRTLNVAGPRGSKCPNIHAAVVRILRAVLSD